MFKKPGRSAIIGPGFLFGFIIWAVMSGSDAFLTSTGNVGLRSTLFLFMVIFVAPVLLIITGIVSETIRRRENRSGFTLQIPYLAGFLAVLVTGFLYLIKSSADQYLPMIEPGLVPRLGFMTGTVIMTMPFVLMIAAIFALLSLAGGYGIHCIHEKTGDQEEKNRF